MTGSGGFWRTSPRRASLSVALLLIATCLPAQAFARDPSIWIPAATLDRALVILARDAGIEIISTEPGLDAIHTPEVAGKMPARRALERLLANSGYRAVPIAGGYRVVRALHRSAAPPRRRALTRAPRVSPPPEPAEIIVTASKQRVPLLRYPGSLTMIAGQDDLSSSRIGDLGDEAGTTPVLQGTQLGAGRNKIFIRGIADSSFNGASQSTASIYLDDLPLSYSGADPGLRLYDLRGIDVMEGPQGTLYGGGAIGGVIRLTSNPADLTEVHASMAAGVTATQSGEPGFDAAGVLNLPLKTDIAGMRGVAYRIRDGGYIDDLGRGLRNINRTDTVGGRLALLADPGEGWRVSLSGAAQQINALDGQYAERAEGPLGRRSLIAQPFDNRLLFGRVMISKEWSEGLRLESASGIAALDATDVFDATPFPQAVPVTYTTNSARQLLTQETRLSRSIPGGPSWVAGLTLQRNRDILSRSLGSPGSEMTIIGVTNVTRAGSVFGELTLPAARDFSVTLGMRGTAARVDGEPSSTPRSGNFVKGRSTRRLDPTIALSWAISSRTAAFARFQTGYRTGGLAVARGIGRVADYKADSIMLGEVGIRRLPRGETGLAFSGSLSFADWDGIQADLINRRGQPYTVNLGNARIETLEAIVDWKPMIGLKGTLSLLYTDNVVTGAIADQSKQDNRRLPDTPPLAIRGGIAYQWKVGPDLSFRMQGALSYVGRSVLGTGDLLDVSQGRYMTLDLGGQMTWQGLEFSLALDNATNRAANRFAFGNPFTLAVRDQTTPLRPRNLRLGIAMKW